MDNYRPVAWHFCSQSNTNKMEEIQKRALKFTSNDSKSPLQDRLRNNNTSFLHTGRMKLMAKEVFKIVNTLALPYLQDLVKIKISKYNFRKENQADIPCVNSTRYCLRSFRYEAARIWNGIPNEMRHAGRLGGCCMPGMAWTASALLVLPGFILFLFLILFCLFY